MHPIFFQFDTPSFLKEIFPDQITIYGYGFSIMVGAIMCYLYIAYHAKKRLGVPYDRVNDLALMIIFASVIGGKIFFYLEAPGHYWAHPLDMFKNFSNGFVFLGSLIFAVFAVYIFLSHHRLPILKMFDIIMIGLCILHIFGRTGCLLAGCCYGKPYDGALAITFTDTLSSAPLHTPLHATQLYSIGMISVIFLILSIVRAHQKFDGQVFLVYLGLYSFARSIVEIFRGDEQRGFIIDNYLSHSQFIALSIIIGVLYFYRKLAKNASM